VRRLPYGLHPEPYSKILTECNSLVTPFELYGCLQPDSPFFRRSVINVPFDENTLSARFLHGVPGMPITPGSDELSGRLVAERVGWPSLVIVSAPYRDDPVRFRERAGTARGKTLIAPDLRMDTPLAEPPPLGVLGKPPKNGSLRVCSPQELYELFPDSRGASQGKWCLLTRHFGG
jgi:hypothetical protein